MFRVTYHSQKPWSAIRERTGISDLWRDCHLQTVMVCTHANSSLQAVLGHRVCISIMHIHKAWHRLYTGRVSSRDWLGGQITLRAALSTVRGSVPSTIQVYIQDMASAHPGASGVLSHQGSSVLCTFLHRSAHIGWFFVVVLPYCLPVTDAI